MFLFHYTSKENCDSMTRETPWNCIVMQPQIGADVKKQHPAGFYVSLHSPSQTAKMDEEEGKTGASGGEKKGDKARKKGKTRARKLGGGAKTGDYVLVFELELKAKAFTNGLARVGNIRMSLVGKPPKLSLTPVGAGANAEGKCVPFAQEMCVWRGPATDCPKKYENDQKIIDSLVQAKTRKK